MGKSLAECPVDLLELQSTAIREISRHLCDINERITDLERGGGCCWDGYATDRICRNVPAMELRTRQHQEQAND